MLVSIDEKISKLKKSKRAQNLLSIGRKLQRKISPYGPMVAIVTLAFLFLFISTALFTYFYFARDVKSKASIMNNNNTGLVLLDRNGKPFFSFYQGKYGAYVPLAKIPPEVQEAVIAAEDKGFYHHPGFSITGIVRSAIADLMHRQIVAGGSTITQQLVKNAILTPRKDFLRKYQEIIVAQEVERRYTKKQILEMYLNSVYFGEGSFGIGQAAERYFGTTPMNLTLAQASMLAGLLPAPSQYSPNSAGDKLAKERQLYVLKSMKSQGYITQKQLQNAYQTKLSFTPHPSNINTVAPHFAIMVRNELIKKYGEETVIRSGFRVKTSIDLSLQKFAEQDVAENVQKLAPDNVSNGAAVVMDPHNGEILAMVGSANWYNKKFGQVNVAESLRQPGSSFKPIVYSLALQERLITPATILQDVPTTFPVNYTPVDYDHKYRGPVTVRRALSNSLNIPSVEVMQKVGVASVVSWAQQLGITTLGDPSQYGLALVLGAGDVKLTELTGVYATFANNGIHNDPTSILQIYDKRGQKIYQYQPKNEQIVDPDVAFLISSILSDAKSRAEEFGNTLNITRVAAVKTGTTNDFRDAWTMGYTPQVTVGVWVGNNDNASMDSIAGSLGAAPIWKDIMEHYLQGKPVLAFNPPPGIDKESVCVLAGSPSSSHAATLVRQEYFLAGTQPVKSCVANTTEPSISPPPPPSDIESTSSANLDTYIQDRSDHNRQKIHESKKNTHHSSSLPFS